MATTDAQVLSKMVDITVLVVQWTKTSRKVVAHVLKTLSSSTGRRVGILLAPSILRATAATPNTATEEYPARPVRAASGVRRRRRT